MSHDGREGEPLPLARPGGLRDSWFDQAPRVSVPPPSGASLPPPPPLPRVGRSLLVGTLVGAIAACVGVVVADQLARRSGAPVSIADALGLAASRGNPRGQPLAAWGFGASAMVGLVLGALVALLTRHVRRALPVLLFGAVFAPIAWLAVHVFVLRRHAAWLAASLPFPATVAGFAVAGALFAAIVPLRGR